jgi:hypothetical protein
MLSPGWWAADSAHEGGEAEAVVVVGVDEFPVELLEPFHRLEDRALPDAEAARADRDVAEGDDAQVDLAGQQVVHADQPGSPEELGLPVRKLHRWLRGHGVTVSDAGSTPSRPAVA